jgi:hypothetical protein
VGQEVVSVCLLAALLLLLLVLLPVCQRPGWSPCELLFEV